MEALSNMSPLTAGAHLQQFLWVQNWIRNSIPSYTTLITPLHVFLKKFYKSAQRRTRLRAARIQLAMLDWGEPE